MEKGGRDISEVGDRKRTTNEGVERKEEITGKGRERKGKAQIKEEK